MSSGTREKELNMRKGVRRIMLLELDMRLLGAGQGVGFGLCTFSRNDVGVCFRNHPTWQRENRGGENPRQKELVAENSRGRQELWQLQTGHRCLCLCVTRTHLVPTWPPSRTGDNLSGREATPERDPGLHARSVGGGLREDLEKDVDYECHCAPGLWSSSYQQRESSQRLL